MESMQKTHPALSNVQHVDIIGDVHGCYVSLVKLLRRLGYRRVNGSWRHPESVAIFVGDIIDRGPGIRECVELVWRMHQEGSALMVLGNHEYNAVRFRDRLLKLISGNPETSLPPRVSRLMKETIMQFMNRQHQWREYTNWFASLPLFIEGPGFRVVHACWDHRLIEFYRNNYPEEGINESFIEAASRKGSQEAKTVDRLTRGTNMPLPEGMQLEGKDGFIRSVFRTKFWANEPETYADVVFQPDPLPYEVAENPILEHHHKRLVKYGPGEPPIFFGHYWMKGRPAPLQDNIACLDYSAVNFGRLTSYRFSGEKVLHPDNFTWVYVDP